MGSVRKGAVLTWLTAIVVHLMFSKLDETQSVGCPYPGDNPAFSGNMLFVR
jgi:hypothetical protein